MIQLTRKLFSLLPDHDGWKIAALILMMLLTALLELIGIGLLPLFVASLTQPDQILQIPQLQGLFNRLNIRNFESLLYFGVALLAVVFIIKNCYVIFYQYVESRYLWNRYKVISSSLFSRYMQAPYTFHLQKNSSLILRNVTEEGRFLVNNVLSSILKLVMNLILTLTIVTLLLYTDPLITATIVFLIGGLGSLVIYHSRIRLTDYGKRANTARGEMIRNVTEGIDGLKDIRVLKKEKWFSGRFSEQVRHYSTLQARFTVIMYSNHPLMETFAIIGMLMIVLFLHWKGTASAEMLALLTLYAAALVRMLPAIREIFRDLNNLSYYSYSVEPIYDDLQQMDQQESDISQQMQEKKYSYSKEERAETKDTTSSFKKSIQFQQVSYRYPDADSDSIQNATFEIMRGELIGISGSTGAGKTTLIDLLLGLLQPHTGSIMVDGMNLQEYLFTNQDPIGYIPQFIFLMDDTLKHNIAIGIPDDQIDEKKLSRAVQLSQLSSVVKALPEGLETMTGEHGVRFSGGQRQRIGIARAIYHQPNLLIMDEATSALDSETERDVMESVMNLRGEHTILMITHRTSTMEQCDRILEIEEGQVRVHNSYRTFLKNVTVGIPFKDKIKNEETGKKNG